MKKYFSVLFAGLAVAGVLSGCSDDDFGNGQDGNKLSAGNTVNFTLGGPTTRTVYDDEDEYQINWTDGDQVRIYCNEAEDVKQADYSVIKSIDPDAENTGTLRYNENGLAWGSESTHNFFAVYPADDSKVSVKNGIATFNVNLNQLCEIRETPTDGNYIAEPDMTNAYMVAHLSTTPIDKVPLHFSPIMTTLKITVRGRELTNTGVVTVTGISIINENVQSSDAMDGKFQYDIAKGTIYNSGTGATPQKETMFVRVKQGDNYYVDLEGGQSVTFTVFLPPLPINASNPVTVRVHATGETTQTVEIDGNQDASGQTIEFAAGAKASLKLPWFPTEQNGNLWMTPLDDNIYVSQLSIPGTHDAATEYCDVASGRCQSRTIAEQLEMGIRCFDLRPAAGAGYTGTALPIKHGIADCNIDLADVFAAFNAFLDEHPGEFIITIMRWESEGDSHIISGDSEFNRRMRAFIATNTYTKYALPRSSCKKDLTVEEARGHILTIMRPNQGSDPDAYFQENAPVGMMYISGFPGSHPQGTRNAYLKEKYVDYGNDQWGARTDWWVYCQNYYEVNQEETDDQRIASKLQSVETYLDYARENAKAGNHIWTINHCSGYLGGSALGSAYARLGAAINRPVYNYIMDESREPGSTGIVLLDYVGDRYCEDFDNYEVCGDYLPQAIIDNNYKYRMLRKTE